jgi:hypothetical protein
VRGRLPALLVRGDTLLLHSAGISRLGRVTLPLLVAGGCRIANVEGLLSNATVDGYPPDIDGILAVRVLASRHAEFDFERNRLGWK